VDSENGEASKTAIPDPMSASAVGSEDGQEVFAGGFRRVLLVGFMGSGKTRVGRLLADRLDWVYRDFDAEISSRVGLSIPMIFRQHGEEFFREVEEQVGTDLLLEHEVVLGSGGGWPASQGRMERLGRSTLSVWLQVTPEESIRRVREDGPTRPLLAAPDPEGRARDLLEEREAFYAKADLAIDTVGSEPDRLAERIEELMKELGRSLIRSLPPQK
jgi:shikimate kinase